MVMQCEPIDRCIAALKAEREYDDVIYVSPDGETFNQKIANEMSMQGNLIILCGHYKGIDQRVRDHLITREISVGDYVLTGGELAAAIISDAVIRLVPGVISDEQSALSDCFQDDILAAPIYTRPADYKGWKVPEILLSGNEAKIRQWEFDQAIERTKRCICCGLRWCRAEKVQQRPCAHRWRSHGGGADGGRRADRLCL